MRATALLALCLPVLAVGSSFDGQQTPILRNTRSTPVSSSSSHTPTWTPDHLVPENLVLRQAPAIASVVASSVTHSSRTTPVAVTLATSTSVIPAKQATSTSGVSVKPAVSVSAVSSVIQANTVAPIVSSATTPIVPAVAPVITTTTSLPPSPNSNGNFVSVQWVETKIGGTSRTWVPKTITFKFDAYTTQGPLPGKGEIGMGTLTGDTGITKTVAMGAAPTHAPGWLRGVAAAVGVGVVGMAV